MRGEVPVSERLVEVSVLRIAVKPGRVRPGIYLAVAVDVLDVFHAPVTVRATLERGFREPMLRLGTHPPFPGLAVRLRSRIALGDGLEGGQLLRKRGAPQEERYQRMHESRSHLAREGIVPTITNMKTTSVGTMGVLALGSIRRSDTTT